MLYALYDLLLRLHPRFFREQFAEEMLWIFDQTAPAHQPALLLDAVRSLIVQWMLRSDFDQSSVPAPTDRVPVFYTIGSEVPPPGALVNGVLGSIIVFSLACLALAHSGSHGRVYTYYGSDFHNGPPTYGVPTTQPAPSTDTPTPGLLARFAAVLRKSPPTPAASQTGQPVSTSLPLAVGPGVSRSTLALRYFKVVPILAALDTDHDGEISAQEIANAPNALATLDKNHDGVLDTEEAGRHPSLSSHPIYSVELLMQYDSNGDGKLQRNELPRNLQPSFNAFDKNHDGVFSPMELRNFVSHMNSPQVAQRRLKADRLARIDYMRMEPVLGVLDADHDGAIAVVEIQNAPAALRTLDRNHDGRLTYDELSRTPLETEVAMIFRLDTNFDGKISLIERANLLGRRVAGLLDAADRDHDGYVTREELTNEVGRRADLNHDGVVSWDEITQARRSGVLYGLPPGTNAPSWNPTLK